MAKKEKLNGSTDLLAQAIRKVFEESREIATADMKEELSMWGEQIRGDLALKADKADIDTTINTTNENMQAQFAEQERKIGKLLSKN